MKNESKKRKEENESKKRKSEENVDFSYEK